MTMAISNAVEHGAKVVICASTGNTSASAAAYAARAGLVCGVVIPEGQIALGKLAQALIHGARVVPMRGNFDHALDIVRELGERPGRRGRELGQPVAHRGPEDRGVRDRRRARRRPHGALHPGRQRGQHHRVLEGLLGVRRARAQHPPAADARLAGGGRRADRARRAGAASRDASPPRSRSATRPPGRARSTPATSRVATSARSPTRRSSRPTGCSRPTRGASSNRRRRPRSPGSCRPRPTACSSPDDVVVCTVTGHGLKDPERAIAEVQVGDPVDASAATVAAALDLA